MKQTIIYVGLDVDDTQYHGTALDKNTCVWRIVIQAATGS